MNTKIKDTRSEQSSHCINCAHLTRASCKAGDVKVNKEFCTFCGPLAAKVISALYGMQLSSKELAQVVADRLPAGIVANQTVITTKEQMDAMREIRVAMDSLQARKEEMRSKINQQTKLN